jgi:hypothetical protein
MGDLLVDLLRIIASNDTLSYTFSIGAALYGLGYLILKWEEYIRNRQTDKETKDIKSYVYKEKSGEEEIPPDIINKVDFFWLKTYDRSIFEIDNPSSRYRCIDLLNKAMLKIEESKSSKNINAINSAYDIIKYTDSIINSLNSSRIYVALLLCVFVVVLTGLTSITWNRWDDFLKIVILGVPLPVLLWGAIGGATAPLYKYLGFKGRYEEDSFKSFVLRPFIGILMGAVIYLVVKSGLIVFGNIPNPQVANPELLWVFAFIGGFSEGITGRALQLIEGSLGESPSTQGPPPQIEGHSKPIQPNSINVDKQERPIIQREGSNLNTPPLSDIEVKSNNTKNANESSSNP